MDSTPFYYSKMFKSVPLGLLLSVFLGPIGLLYASLRGGIIMILIGIVLISALYPFPIMLWWLACAIWSVAAIEKHNKKQLQQLKADK
jgi:hypothetical protein